MDATVDVTDGLEQARIACAKGEYGKANLILAREAERGDAEALFLLGNIMADGMGQVLSGQDGSLYLKKSADQGFLPAVYKLRQLNNKHVSFFWAPDVEQNRDAVLDAKNELNRSTLYPRSYFSDLKQKKNVNPSLRVYRDSIDLPESSSNMSTEEQNRLQELAVGGEVSAMYDLSVFLRHSPKKTDQSSGVFWLGKAAQQGYLIAQYEFGMCCLEGRGVAKDLLQACLWFKRAAEKDYVPALYALAKVYIDKSLGLYNPDEGLTLLKRIKQQSPEALIMLARLCTTGDILPRDDAMAKSYLKQAVDGGSEQALIELAKLLVEQKNYRDGLPLLTEAAARNNLEAIVLLAALYHKGLGVAQLDDKAAFLYYKAACMGSAEAQYEFASILMASNFAHERTRGLKWCAKAALQHHVAALSAYGTFLKNDADAKIGTTKAAQPQKWLSLNTANEEIYSSYKVAFGYLLEAAEGGDSKAQYIVAEMYRNGQGVLKNIAQSVSWCKKAAIGGNIEAQFKMAELYNHGEIFEANLEQAAEWYRSAASNGSVAAAYQLGLLYHEGRGVIQSDVQAMRYFEQAATKNYAPAIRELGWHFLHGIGCDIDCNKAEGYLLRAAEQENEDAVIDLFELYRQNPGTSNKMAEALKLLTKLSDEGRPQSTYLLAKCNFNGIGLKENASQGLELLKKSANLGCAQAQLDLGQLYYDGRLVACNYQKAVMYFRKAAEQKSAKALYVVGTCARDGMGTLVNYSEAVACFKASAEQGYSLSYLALGEMYENGVGVITSQKEALRYYRLLAYSDYNDAFPLIADILVKGGGEVEANPEEAAQWLLNGVKRGHSGCCYRLAQMHFKKDFEMADTATGMRLMNKAAELGNCEALYFLAQAYLKGNMVQANVSKAFYYCQKAAALNHIKATTLLGQMFLEGRGCDRNTVMAFDLFSTSANMGDYKAQYELALLFKNGDGVQQSFIDAYVWSVLALTGGDKIGLEASSLRDDVVLELTLSQLKEAQYIASERLMHIKPPKYKNDHFQSVMK